MDRPRFELINLKRHTALPLSHRERIREKKGERRYDRGNFEGGMGVEPILTTVEKERGYLFFFLLPSSLL
jgi:hypothetical protein